MHVRAHDHRVASALGGQSGGERNEPRTSARRTADDRRRAVGIICIMKAEYGHGLRQRTHDLSRQRRNAVGAAKVWSDQYGLNHDVSAARSTFDDGFLLAKTAR